MDDAFVSLLAKVAPNVAYLIGIGILIWKISRHTTKTSLLLSKLTEGQVEIKGDVKKIESRVGPLEIEVAKVKGHLNLNGFAHQG